MLGKGVKFLAAPCKTNACKFLFSQSDSSSPLFALIERLESDLGDKFEVSIRKSENITGLLGQILKEVRIKENLTLLIETAAKFILQRKRNIFFPFCQVLHIYTYSM